MSQKSILKLKWIKDKRTGWIIGIEVAVLLVGAAFFLPGGQDLKLYYIPFAEGCLTCGFVPFFSQPLLVSLKYIPDAIVWPFWTLVSVGTLLWLCKKTSVNPGVLILTFPFLGQFWLGQVDVILCVGLVLAIFSKKPSFRGTGLAILMVKPQVVILLVIYLIVREDRKHLLKVLAVPAIVFLTSLYIYGRDWPVVWLQNALEGIPAHAWKMAAGFFWPWGIVLSPLPFLFKDRKDGAIVSLLVSSLAIPFFSVYTYIVFLLLESPWWVLPISYAWLIGYPFLGIDSMKFSWLLPVVLLIRKIIQSERFGLFLPKKRL